MWRRLVRRAVAAVFQTSAGPAAACSQTWAKPHKLLDPLLPRQPVVDETAGSRRAITGTPTGPEQVQWSRDLDRIDSNDIQMNELWLGGGRVTKDRRLRLDWAVGSTRFYGTTTAGITWPASKSHSGNGQFYGYAMRTCMPKAAYNNWTIGGGPFRLAVVTTRSARRTNFFPVIPYTYNTASHSPYRHLAFNKAQRPVDRGGRSHGWDTTDNTGQPVTRRGLLNATWTIDEQRRWPGSAFSS